MEVCRRVGLACRVFQLWEDTCLSPGVPTSLSQGMWKNAARETLQSLGSRSKVLQLIRDGTKLASLPPCLATDCDPGAMWSPAQHPHCPAALNSSMGLDLWAMALSVSPLGQADTAVTKTDKVPADIYHSVSKVEISKQGHYRVG